MAPGVRLTDDQRLDWLRLIRSENVGPRTFKALLNRYGGARAALAALPGLARRGGAVRAPHVTTIAEAERELVAGRRLGVRLVALGEPDYPPALQAIDDAPPLIGVRGKLDLLQPPAVGIVGARNASAAGLMFAEKIARELGDAGFVIVSGLARGIDGAAHRGSISHGTIAVVAGGQDCPYPPEHTDLLEAIAGAGAVVSEMPMGWVPRGRDFPRRNRIISGLVLGVVVVEAARRSGSLITARRALDHGREVFAVPGSPIDPRSEGTNDLLKQGATLVTAAADVVTALEPMLGRPFERPLDEPAPITLLLPFDTGPNHGGVGGLHPDGLTPDDLPRHEPAGDGPARDGITALLGPTPVAIDDLIRWSGAPTAAVLTTLLELELAGRLDRQRGGRVALL